MRTDVNTEEIRADTTIAQILAGQYVEVRFRAAFKNHPALQGWTVHSVTESAESLDAFLQVCRSLPQFGDVQEVWLLDILEDLSRSLGRGGLSLRYLKRWGRLSAKSFREQPIDGAKSSELNGIFYSDFIPAFSDVYLTAWRLAHFDAFLYVPSSIPEFVKHPDVLRAEIGPEIDVSAYTSQCAGLRESLSSVSCAEGVVLIDRKRLDMVFGRHGPYSGLGTDTLEAQRRMLCELDSILPSSVKVGVCDVEAARLSSFSVIGVMITLAVAGGYLVTRDQALQSLLEKRCTSAMQGACSLAAYFADGHGANVSE